MKNQLLLILLLLYVTISQANIVICRSSPFSFPDTLPSKKTGIYLSSGQSITINNLINLSKDNYPIQLGAFRQRSNADALYRKIKEVLGEDVKIIEEDGYYKVRLTKLNDKKEMKFLSPVYFSDMEQTEEKEVTVNTDTNNTPVFVSDTLKTSTAIAGPTQIPALSYKTQIIQSVKKLRHKFIFIGNNSPWLKKLNYFGKSFALINALIIVIIGSILTMIVLLTIILLNRTRMEKEERLRQFLMEKYQKLILDYLFGDNIPDEFMTIASDNYRRQILIDQMIDVSINLKGEAQQKLQKLYLKMDLDRDSVNKAYNRKWHRKVKAFRELAYMNIRDANDEIYRCLESKNEILRIEAQIALVRLSDDNPFEFLHHLERPFSLWEQITLYELLVHHEMKVPLFNQWLTSPNFTIVMFSLRMIREYKQIDSEKDVLKVLKHNNPDVRKLAIEVTGDMGMKEALEILKRMYKNENYDNCLEIVRSMGKMPDEAMLGFLKLVIDKEDNVQLQIEATKAIENMGEVGVKALVKIMKSEYKNYNIIIRHVLDRRIN